LRESTSKKAAGLSNGNESWLPKDVQGLTGSPCSGPLNGR